MQEEGFGPGPGDIGRWVLVLMGLTTVYYCSKIEENVGLLNRVYKISDLNQNDTLEDEELRLLCKDIGVVINGLESTVEIEKRIEGLSADAYRRFIEQHEMRNEEASRGREQK